MENKWIKIVGIVLLTVVISFLTVNAIGRTNTDSNSGSSVYEKVVKSGVITACYVPYPPTFIKDPNTGQLSGIFYDSLNKAAANLGLEVDWKIEVDWGSLVQSLNSGKCDIVGSGVWDNSSRAKGAEFSVPLYFSGINAYVRTSDNRFNGNAFIANDPKYTVVYEDGETSQNIVQKQFPKAKTVSLPQTADVSIMLLDVVSNKADMAFAEPSIAEQFLKTNPGTIKNVSISTPVAVYGNVMMVKKGEFEFLTMINGALNELVGTNYIHQLIDQYGQNYSTGFYEVSPRFFNQITK